jgi:shikimate dehydrogenase
VSASAANGPGLRVREITGTTRVYAILADPIGQVRTPQALNPLMRERGVDGVMVPLHVAAPDLPRLVDGLRGWRNFGGGIVTVPHKTAMLALCDSISERARAVGAVNTIRREPDGRLVGEMLDGLGFVAGLRQAGIDPRGARVYLAGAGGAANAIAFALAEAGAARLTVANRTRPRAEDLQARLAAAFPGIEVAIGSADPGGHDLVVNATSLGLRPDDPLPLDPAGLAPAMTVAEIIMQPEVTPLLAAARSAGCRIHPGAPMLAGQLALMAAFLGVDR